MSVRTQHLTAQISKRVFESAEFGIMRCRDMVYGVEEYGMKPLLVVGISYEQLPIHFTQFYSLNEPVKLEQFLMDFWNYEHENPSVPANPITGKPDLLVIDARIESLIEPSFFEWLALNDINYEFSSAKSRKFSAVVRQHQSYPEISIDPHTPTVVDGDVKEKYQLTLENLNQELKGQQFVYPFVTKQMRQLLNSPVWSDQANTVVLPPNVDTVLKIDTEMLSRHTQNDLPMLNPHWQATIIEPVFTYGYLVNNFEEDAGLSPHPKSEDLKIAVKAMEYLWPLFSESVQLRLKQFKTKGYKQLDNLSAANINELLHRTGLEIAPSGLDAHQGIALEQISSYVYDVSKLDVTEISKLWDALQLENGQSFEIIPMLATKKSKYRIYVAQKDSKNFVFLCCCRYKNYRAFDEGHCNGYNNGAIKAVNKILFDNLVKTALSGQSQVFDYLNEHNGADHISEVA